ncbi:MAG: translation initiation factor IF-2 [Bacteroidales bacterium]|nr:translation initiation factor IF-2 [Bacteroidales bacterium]
MSEVNKSTRLGKAAQEFNVGVPTIVEFLHKKGIKIDNNPNTKLDPEVYAMLVKEYQLEKNVKEVAKKIELEYTQHKTLSINDKRPATEDEFDVESGRKELFIRNMPPEPEPAAVKPKPVAEEAPVKPKPAEPKQVIPTAPPTAEEKPEVVATAEEPVAPVLPTEDKPVKPEPVEAKQETIEPKPEPKPEPEARVAEPAAPHDDKTLAESASATSVAETGTEEPAQIGQLKVLGKMDLDSLNKPKSKSKTKSKSDKTAEETAPAAEEPTSTEVKPKDTPEPAVDQPVAATPAEPVQPVEQPVVAQPEKEPVVEKESNFIKTDFKKLEGVTILGTMKLPEVRKPEPKKPVASSSDDLNKSKKKKRKRIKKQGEETTGQNREPQQGSQQSQGTGPQRGKPQRDKKGSPRREAPKVELTPEDIQKQIKETLQRLSGGGKSKASKHRREKRSLVSQMMAEEAQKMIDDQKVITVTEFVTANEMASLMNVQVTQVISTCLSLGLFVSINQRLDAETIVVVADEFGFTVKFVGLDAAHGEEDAEDTDSPDDLEPRAPIVTVMGHVDHGKTSLLDYIRHSNVIAGEAGGITQHIGAYEVQLDNGKKITFLDTPGHEAFTAMRARGAKITDIVIIVIAADDTVMPQTIEAINHAQAAGVPIVFAINKIDKNNANPEKIKEELSKRNILVEDWGGKYQSQEISAKKGLNVELLLEKVLLEAELLELKANPNRLASGTVLESSLDKGRGYVAKILVQTGTLKPGDMVLAGTTYGKVKAMYNERNIPIREAGPSTPLLLLGLSGAPLAGDTFKVMRDEKEAKSIAAKRMQLQREQGIRTQKHITLDEIGRRIAIGDFKELNIIVKGDVDGSVEALSDSMMKLSTPEVQVNIIHKSVGAVTESDVLLASASNAIIVGFQVRPSLSARKLAEQEQIDIRTYSIIYTAINEIKAAIEGMLSPDIEEKIVCNLEVREAFNITKVGTVAGCMVLDGKITRNTKIRIIRDGIVVHTGVLGSLKRFKDDVKEVSAGYECGLNIDRFNDIKVKDIIEGYEEVEIKRKL